MTTTYLTYPELKTLALSKPGWVTRIREIQTGKGVNLLLRLDGVNYTMRSPINVGTEDHTDYLANIHPNIKSDLTQDGLRKSPPSPAGPQDNVEMVGDHYTFELLTDTAWGQTASEQNPCIEYHKYPVPETLYLNGIIAAWQDVPRFTNVSVKVGYYTGETEDDFVEIGGFTLDSGFTLAGTNDVGTAYPPGTNWAEAMIPHEVAPGVPVYLRFISRRVRPCLLDASNNEIAPYIDLDFGWVRRS